MLHFINVIRIAPLLALIPSSCRAEEANKDGGYGDLLKNAMKDYFNKMDTNKDDVLSRDEVLTGFLIDWEEKVWAKVCTDDGLFLDELKSDTFIGDLENAIGEDIDYDDIDTNGDGEIDKEEARRISEINLERTVFEKGDLNKDGVFQYVEFLRQVMEFQAKHPPEVSIDAKGSPGKNPIIDIPLNDMEEDDDDDDEEDDEDEDDDDDSVFTDGRSEDDDEQTTTGDEL